MVTILLAIKRLIGIGLFESNVPLWLKNSFSLDTYDLFYIYKAKYSVISILIDLRRKKTK